MFPGVWDGHKEGPGWALGVPERTQEPGESQGVLVAITEGSPEGFWGSP